MSEFPKRWSSRRVRWHTALAEELIQRGFRPSDAAYASRMALSDARIRFGDRDYDWGPDSIQIFVQELSRQ